VFSLGTMPKPIVKERWRSALSDYVSAIAWSPVGNCFAACSTAGEVHLYLANSFDCVPLQSANGKSIDCLAFSHDGKFLAVGGQTGELKIWQVSDRKLVTELNHAPVWIDQMAWSPVQNQLAFSVGKSVQVWDAEINQAIATLNFNDSSVLNIRWHPMGESVGVAGYQGIKIWMATDWQDDPYLLTIPSATGAIAWSPDGTYIAAGNLDRTITVLEWSNPAPWVMRGFPGKIRHLIWSDHPVAQNAPMMVSASAESIVVWEKHPDDMVGWEGRVLGTHDDTVQAIQFQPNSLLLASAAVDGTVALWRKATQMTQVLEGAIDGFSCLAWHPQGTYIVAGGTQGELLVWEQIRPGQGFGQR
jgi:WD40 repeat protein